MRNFKLLVIGCIAVILASCQGQTAPVHPSVKTEPAKKVEKIATVIQRDTICIAATGDIMLGTSYPDSSKLPPDSAKNSFNAVIPDLQGADLVFGNLEGALLDTGMPATYKKKLETAYLFRMPIRYGQVLKDAGFNLLSVANNHITDFDKSGTLSTTKTLDQHGINYAGLLSCPTTVFERNGVKYGFCAFAPNANTVPMLDFKNAATIISKLKQQCDIVIVSFHGGAEGTAFEHIPFNNESYMGGKRGDVHAFAHNAVDAGADIVLGHGPHVSRAIEKYNNRLIAYSLGNFCTYKSVSVLGVCGMAPLLKVYLNKKGEFLNGRIVSFRQTHENGLVKDTLNKAANRIRLLTKADFPQPGLEIADDGLITTAD